MITTNALDTFAAAEQERRRGALDEALAHYLMVVRGVPGDWRARLRVADVLAALDAALASPVYAALAAHAVRAGQPLQALVAIKLMATLGGDPGELFGALAERYAHGSLWLDRDRARVPTRPLKKTDPVGSLGGLAGRALYEAAAAEAAATDTLGPAPDTVPPIPLLSLLDAHAFTEVAAGIGLRRFATGEAVLRQGEPGDSFFLVADGDLDVVRESEGRETHLARLGSGAVLGEMALVKSAPRAATVRAVADSDLVELSRDFLLHEGAAAASIAAALHAFTRERFLLNLAGSCALFAPLPRAARGEAIKRFVEVRAAPGARLIEEGAAGHGLYLVVEGEVEVAKRGPAGEQRIATLCEKDFFGEISLVHDTPASASCTARGPVELLFLEREAFAAVVDGYPELRDALARVSAARLDQARDALGTGTAADGDEPVLML